MEGAQPRYLEAIADFTAALQLDPLNATAYRNRGIAYKLLGQYEIQLSKNIGR
jgi:tetratricopeptide (TPR) repeat protein